MAEQQVDPAALQSLLFLQTLSQPSGIVHLGPGVSINLSKVNRYEPIERMTIEKQGDGKAAVEIEVGTGEFDAAILMDSGDYLILTEDQNEVFRTIWDQYSRISHEVFNLAGQIFPKPLDIEPQNLV